MADTRKTVLQPSVDASKVKQGFQQIKDGARDMGQGVAAAGQQAAAGVDAIASKAAPTAEKLDASAKRMVASIQRTAAAMEAGGRASAKYYEIIAAQRGVDVNALRPYLKQLEEAELKQSAAAKSLTTYGMSAAQTANSLRMVGPQITDIVTGLASGQAPLTVLIQQGGQLKDVFGGIGPAARAVSGYVLGMVNPFTVGAAALGTLAYAAIQGAKELSEFQKVAALTGNASGLSASGFTQLRDSLVAIAGTKGKAAEVLTEIASNGQIAGDQIKAIGEAAILMEKATGQSVGKTVSQFAELAKAPADASAKLNEQYNYLTASVYKQIKALEDQGNKVAAANLAEKTYADAMKTRTQAVVDSAGAMEKAWRSVADGAKKAWDAMLGIGRDLSTAEKLAEVQAKIAKGQGPFDASTFGGNAEARAQLPELREQARALQRKLEIEQGYGVAVAENNRLQQLGIEFQKQGEQFLTKQQQRERELAKARKEGQELVRAGIITETELTQRLAGIRQKYNDTSGESGVSAQRAARLIAQEENRRLQASIANLDFTTPINLTDAEKKVIVTQEELKGSLLGVARANKERELAAAQAAVQDERSTQLLEKQRDAAKRTYEVMMQQIAAAGDQADAIMRQAEQQEAANATFGRGATAIQQLVLQQLKLQAAEAESSDRFDPRYVAGVNAKVAAQERLLAALQQSEAQQLRANIIEGTRVSKEESDTLVLEYSLIGQTAEVRERILGQRKAELELAKEIAKTDKSGATPEEKDQLKSEARAKFEIDKQNAASRAVLTEWQKTADSINQSLTDALLRGFESGKSFAENFRDTVVNAFKTMVLRPVISAVMSPIAGVVAQTVNPLISAATGSSVASSAGGNLISSGVSSIGSAFMSGYTGATAAGSALTGASAVTSGGFGVGAGATGLTEMATIGGGTAATAGAGGLAAGASSALAAIPVAGWVALAAIAAYSIFGKKGGGPKVDGHYGPVPEMGVGYADNQDATPVAKDLAKSLEASYKQITRGLGLDAVKFGIGISSDPKGTSPSFVQAVATRNGELISNRVDLNAGRDEAALKHSLEVQSTQVIYDALKSAKLGENLSKLVGDATDFEGEQAAIARVTAGRQIEEELLKLQSTQFENLARARQAELDDADDLTDVLLRQKYAFEDLVEKRGLEERLLNATRTAAEQSAAARQKELDAFVPANRALLEAAQTAERMAAIGSRAKALATQFAPEGQESAVLTQQIVERLTAAGLPATVDVIAKASKQSFLDYAELLKKSGNVDGLEALYDVADTFLNVVQKRSEDVKRAADEQLSLQVQLLTAEGKTTEVRRLQLQSINESNRALQMQVWAAEDAAKANEDYARSLDDARSFLAGFSDSIKQYVDKLDTDEKGLKSPKDRVSAAQSQFDRQYALAAGGNRDALSSITQYADQYIGAQTDYTASSKITKDVIAAVKTRLAALPGQVTAEQLVASAVKDAAALTVAAIGDLKATLASKLDLGFDRFDTSLDGQLSLSEFMQGLAGLASNDVLRQEFGRLDANGDQLISRAEATTGAILDLRGIVDTRLSTGFAQLDTSLDGMLSGAEFLAGFHGLASDATLQQIYATIDTNGDGQISRLEAIAGSTGGSKESLDALLQRIGTNSLLAYSASTAASAFAAIITNTGSTAQEVYNAGQAIVSALHALQVNVTVNGGTSGTSGAATTTAPPPQVYTPPPVVVSGSGYVPGGTTTESGNVYDPSPNLSLYDQAKASGLSFYVWAERNGYSYDAARAYLQSTGLPLFATGAAFKDGIVSRPTAFNIGVMGEGGQSEAIMPLANIGGRLGVRSAGGDNRELVAAIEALDKRLAAIQANTAREDASVVQVILDGRKVMESTLKALKDRSRRGEPMVYDAGVVS
jgi:phage-related minor tail protein